MPEDSDSLVLTLPSETSSSPNIPDILQQYLSGASVQDLAKESCIPVRTLYRWMMTECGEGWHDLVTEALANRIADADMELMNAKEPWQIARAREYCRFARMDFERRRPKLYGPKQEISTDKTVHVHVHRAPQQVVVEGQMIEADSQVIEKTED